MHSRFATLIPPPLPLGLSYEHILPFSSAPILSSLLFSCSQLLPHSSLNDKSKSWVHSSSKLPPPSFFLPIAAQRVPILSAKARLPVCLGFHPFPLFRLHCSSSSQKQHLQPLSICLLLFHPPVYRQVLFLLFKKEKKKNFLNPTPSLLLWPPAPLQPSPTRWLRLGVSSSSLPMSFSLLQQNPSLMCHSNASVAELFNLCPCRGEEKGVCQSSYLDLLWLHWSITVLLWAVA